MDKQLGSGSSASGSTSVTEKGAVPEILAFAVENGALTKSQSGTTISFKGNPVGIVNSLIANSLPPTGPLSRLAFGLEFDASRGSDESQAPVFEGDPQQLSAFSVKYEILNHRDPDSRQFQERADRLYAEAKSGTTTSTREINQTLLVYETDFARTMTRAGAPRRFRQVGRGGGHSARRRARRTADESARRAACAAPRAGALHNRGACQL